MRKVRKTAKLKKLQAAVAQNQNPASTVMTQAAQDMQRALQQAQDAVSSALKSTASSTEGDHAIIVSAKKTLMEGLSRISESYSSLTSKGAGGTSGSSQ